MRDIVRALLVLSMFHGVVQGGPPPDQDVRKNGTPQALSEEMILLGEDWYYPQEEPAERAELSVPKLEQLEEEAAMLVLAEEESPARVAVGETRGGWRVMAVLPEPEGMVVLEKEFQRWGVIFFLNRQGVVAEIRKSVGHLEAIRGPRYGLSDSYFNTIVHDDKDLLANRIFEDTGDPSYESLVGMLAPLHTYTFLGTPDSAEKMAIQHDGKIGILPKKWGGDKKLERVLLDPNTVFAKQVDLADPRAMKRGLLGRHLPAINYGCFDLGKDFGWELCALAPPEAPGAVLARLRSSEGITHYYRIAPLESLEDGRAFYRALIESHRHWQSFFEKGAGWNIPDPRVEDATRGAIVRALSGCVGLHPKYGMGGYWGGKSHDGFPPTVLSLCTCLLDWGFDEAARDRLEYYYSHFVKPDGTLDYYGPAVAEYGQLLDLGVAVARKTGDPAWFDRQSAAIGRMADHLLGLREQSLREQSPADPGYGLLFGPAEADNCKKPDYFFSGSAWAWRGLREVGKFQVELGQQRDDPQLEARGRELLSECEMLRKDILRAVGRCVVGRGRLSFLPPMAKNISPFERMTQNRLAWYTNYRYWPEVLSAECLPKAYERMMIEYRRARAGECLGMTRFKEDELDNWPYYHHARGLLAHNQVRHFLLGYFAHMAHHQMQGTFTAYEHVNIRGSSFRREYADYCVPAQLTVPLMTRWMLVQENRDKAEIRLCRAVPRAWFSKGFSFREMPTRWGPVSVSVEPDEESATTTIHITGPPSKKLSVILHLRSPKTLPITTCEVTGARHDGFDSHLEQIRLAPQARSMTIRISLGQ